MTVYFDDLQRRVTELGAQSDEEFLRDVAALEDEVIRTVGLCTGDREFPEEHRERIQGTIALKSLRYGPEKAKDYLLATRAHGLLAGLHTQFHILAGERISTRFGILFDDPAANVRARDRHDADGDDEVIDAAGDSRKEVASMKNFEFTIVVTGVDDTPGLSDRPVGVEITLTIPAEDMNEAILILNDLVCDSRVNSQYEIRNMMKIPENIRVG